MGNRADFTKPIRDTLAKRVGYLCSNPACRKPTVGANLDKNKFTLTGVAAHIIAASKGGPRYDGTSPEERKDIDNGIWLCQSCSVLIDRDSTKYPASLLLKWKAKAEINLSGAESFIRRPATNNLPENQNIHFTGRYEVLEGIYNTFEKQESVALTQAIAGLGGVGKTQVALEYAYRHIDEYEYIWWVNAAEDTILASFYSFAKDRKIISEEAKEEASTIIKAVRDWMLRHDNWLFIYDNAEGMDKTKDGREFKEYLPQQNIGRRHVLITSRKKNWSQRATVIPLDVFSPDEAFDFLTSRTGLPCDKYQEELAKKLGYLSLALAQAGAYISNNSNCNYKEYLVLLDEYQLGLLEDSPDEISKQSVNATWDISFKEIKKESSRVLLNLCAFLAPDNIRCEWFTAASEVLPESLQEAVSNKREFNKVITELTKYSLVDCKDNVINIHRLVQEVIRDSLKEEEKTKWRNYCVSILNKFRFTDFSTAKYRADFLTLAPHIDSVTNGVSSDDATVEVSQLYHFLGRGFDELANYPQALEWYGKALNICEKTLGEEHPDTAATYNNIGRVYRTQGSYERALEYLRKALNTYEKALGKEHPYTAATYNNMATVYDAKADYKRALEYYGKALNIREDVLGKRHPDTATTYHNMAATYSVQGDYERALEYYRKALNIREDVSGKEHPDTATTYNNIGGVYHAKGDYICALEYHRKDLNISEKVLGKDHPDTATAYNNIATVYGAKGDYDCALEWYQKSLSVLIKVLGDEHPLTKKVSENTKTTYKESGKPEPFEEWFEREIKGAL